MIHCRFRLPWSSDWLGVHAIDCALEFGTVFLEKSPSKKVNPEQPLLGVSPFTDFNFPFSFFVLNVCASSPADVQLCWLGLGLGF